MQNVPPEWHDLSLTFGEARLHAEVGLAPWLSADLQWSLRLVHVGFQLEDANHTPIAPPFGEELHHRTETLVGPADPWLSLRSYTRRGPWTFGARLGATVPVGSTVANPFARGRAGEAHQHLQFGTGTVNPFAQLEVRRGVGRFEVGLWALGRATRYRNGHGYQAGDQLLAGLGALSERLRDGWTFAAGALVFHEEPERWDGVVETEGNLGRTDLLLEGSAAWRVARSWTVTFAARVPVWSDVVGAQLDTPALGELTLARSFDL